MTNYLNWPTEPDSEPVSRWHHPASNLCLDFHGDPANAELVVYSDGNHHMALAELIASFQQQTAGLSQFFYATTPPSVILKIIEHGQLQMGNLVVSRQPHIFISPENIVQKVIQMGKATKYQAFMQSQGNVLLVRKGNPKSINSLHDLLRDDVTLFISNPVTESASHVVYKETLLDVGKELSIQDAIAAKLDADCPSLLYGECIHHRELPQALYDGRADVAVVYYHLALRYSRIFADDFSFMSLAGGKINSEVGNQKTTYHIACLNDAGSFGELFLNYCFSDEATEIYQRHGLTRPT